MSNSRLENLRKQHRMLDRLIDTTKALTRYEEVKELKRRRLQLKDRIARLSS